jgi:hypothetical protein
VIGSDKSGSSETCVVSQGQVCGHQEPRGLKEEINSRTEQGETRKLLVSGGRAELTILHTHQGKQLLEGLS